MKLTVWIARQNDDSDCYNIVAKTKKDALRQIAERTEFEWEPPYKLEIVYKDAFDLYEWLTSEAGAGRT